MNARRAWVSAGAGLAVVASPGLSVPAAVAASATTPDSCIEVNGGDWNACNVGHGGRGDLPYLPVRATAHSVAGCTLANQGDALACLVGSVDGYYPR
jgi:hypothetical protein